MSIKLLIADDHEAVRAGLAGMAAGTEIEIVGQAATLDDAVHQTLARLPDVLLLDLRFRDDDVFPALEQIRRKAPGVSILIFTASDNLADMTRARELGASGYVIKSAGRDELLHAIRRAAGAHDAWTRQQIRRVSGTVNGRELATGQDTYLTPREKEVLRKVVAGLLNEDIAAQLNIHAETVKQHVKHILRKLGVEHRTQAAIWAVRNGMD